MTKYKITRKYNGNGKYFYYIYKLVWGIFPVYVGLCSAYKENEDIEIKKVIDSYEYRKVITRE